MSCRITVNKKQENRQQTRQYQEYRDSVLLKYPFAHYPQRQQPARPRQSETDVGHNNPARHRDTRNAERKEKRDPSPKCIRLIPLRRIRFGYPRRVKNLHEHRAINLCSIVPRLVLSGIIGAMSIKEPKRRKLTPKGPTLGGKKRAIPRTSSEPTPPERPLKPAPQKRVR